MSRAKVVARLIPLFVTTLCIEGKLDMRSTSLVLFLCSSWLMGGSDPIPPAIAAKMRSDMSPKAVRQRSKQFEAEILKMIKEKRSFVVFRTNAPAMKIVYPRVRPSSGIEMLGPISIHPFPMGRTTPPFPGEYSISRLTPWNKPFHDGKHYSHRIVVYWWGEPVFDKTVQGVNAEGLSLAVRYQDLSEGPMRDAALLTNTAFSTTLPVFKNRNDVKRPYQTIGEVRGNPDSHEMYEAAFRARNQSPNPLDLCIMNAQTQAYDMGAEAIIIMDVAPVGSSQAQGGPITCRAEAIRFTD